MEGCRNQREGRHETNHRHESITIRTPERPIVRRNIEGVGLLVPFGKGFGWFHGRYISRPQHCQSVSGGQFQLPVALWGHPRALAGRFNAMRIVEACVFSADPTTREL